MSDARPWLMARWKARGRLCIRVNLTFFAILRFRSYKAKCVQLGCSHRCRPRCTQILPGQGRPPSTILGVRKLETLGYPTVKTASLCVLSCSHNTGMWRTDRQTDGRSAVKRGILWISSRQNLSFHHRTYMYCVQLPLFVIAKIEFTNNRLWAKLRHRRWVWHEFYFDCSAVSGMPFSADDQIWRIHFDLRRKTKIKMAADPACFHQDKPPKGAPCVCLYTSACTRQHLSICLNCVFLSHHSPAGAIYVQQWKNALSSVTAGPRTTDNKVSRTLVQHCGTHYHWQFATARCHSLSSVHA